MTEQMKKKIEQFCIANDLLHKKDGIVVGVSGGADSVFLIYFLKEIMERWELRLHVVHINHGIRGKEALHDEQYTKELSKRFSIPCTIFRENIPKRATEWKMTEEEAGRTYRYQCFEKVRQELGFGCGCHCTSSKRSGRNRTFSNASRQQPAWSWRNPSEKRIYYPSVASLQQKRLKTLYRKNIFHIAPIKQTDRMIIREMRSETVLFLQCKSTFSQKLHSILPKAGCICRKSWNIWIGKGIEFMRGSLHSYRKSK